MGGALSDNQMKTLLKHKEEQSGQSFLAAILSGVRNWHLILILIPLIFIAATLLRLDRLRMNELLEAVMTADNADYTLEEAQAQVGMLEPAVADALYELKDFMDHHIVVNFVEKNGVNHLEFGTGPFYLEGSYKRKAAAAIAEAERKAAELPDANPNGNIFAEALRICQPQAIANGWAWNSQAYINCYYDIVYSYPATDELTTSVMAEIPSTALFRYDFISPVWWPSASGWVILVCVILVIVILARALYWVVLQVALRIVK